MATFNVPGLGVSATGAASSFGAVTVTGLTVNGNASVAGELLQTGSAIARFENTFGTVPLTATGIGAEIGVAPNGGSPYAQVQSFNRSLGALAALVLSGSSTQVLGGSLIVGTDPGGTELLRVGGSIRSSSTLIGTGAIINGDPGGGETVRISGSLRSSAGYKSTGGVTAAIANGASQSVFVPTVASCAVLLFMQGTVNTSTYAVVLAHVDSAGNMGQMTVLASASMTPTIGSSTISVTNNSGSTQGVNWGATYFGI